MSYQVQFENGESFDVRPEETVLQAALRADVRLPSDCQLGGCGTCRIRLLQGQVSYDEQPFALTPEEQQQGYALACQARPCSDLLITSGNPAAALPPPVHVAATIKAITPVTADVLHLVLETPEPVPFLPGQYMNVHLGDGSVRSFSMASSPGGRMLDFFVKRVPDGQFTDRQLSHARPGQTLQVTLPLGEFILHPADYRPLLMVATGTGIAPIRAMLESLLDDPECPPVWLYWGMRTEADLWLRDALSAWRERLYDFQFIPVLSRANDGWDGRRGHVQQAIAQDFDDLSEHAIYLCGAPDMVRQAKSTFIAHGASIDHLYADTFNFTHQLEQKKAA